MSVMPVLEEPVNVWDWRQRLIEVIMAAPEPPAKPKKMSYEEFLAWADEDTLAEWVDGEVVMTSPASDRHQDLARFLTVGLSGFVEVHGLGIIRPAPFQVKLERGREPDLLFLGQAHLARLKQNYVDGPPDLVVEIISPESATRDRGEKYYEYEAGGVPECWLIDPVRKWAEFYRLGEFGLYEPIFSGREGIFHSEVLPGFWLRVEWLWQEPLPNSLRVLGEIAGIAPQTVEQFMQALGSR